jgi:hypothetical protein
MAVKIAIRALRLTKGPVDIKGNILRRQWKNFQGCV